MHDRSEVLVLPILPLNSLSIIAYRSGITFMLPSTHPHPTTTPPKFLNTIDKQPNPVNRETTRESQYLEVLRCLRGRVVRIWIQTFYHAATARRRQAPLITSHKNSADCIPSGIRYKIASNKSCKFSKAALGTELVAAATFRVYLGCHDLDKGIDERQHLPSSTICNEKQPMPVIGCDM
jgi:hypothetical protein